MTEAVGARSEPSLTPLRLEVVPRLDDAAVRAVGLLLERVTEADGMRPLSEHVTLHLRYGGDEEVVHVLAWGGADPDGGRDQEASRLVAYAHMDITDPVDGPSAEVAVDPIARRRGVARAVVEALIAATPSGRMRLWSHGDHPAAQELASSLGFTRSRLLHQMRRSLFAPLPEPALAHDVSVRTFIRGRDEDAWLALNAEAFADHPEQGRLTRDQLEQRMDEPWFDADGFFLAESGGSLVGFHWTKVHGGHVVHSHDEQGLHSHEGHGHEPIGEIYALGVSPDHAGRGIGKALALIGLRHLRTGGLGEAMLFVDADNVGAIALYEGLAFRIWDTDVMFSRA